MSLLDSLPIELINILRTLLDFPDFINLGKTFHHFGAIYHDLYQKKFLIYLQSNRFPVDGTILQRLQLVDIFIFGELSPHLWILYI